MSRARRVAGTTLIEVLVVIVIFLIGILAVVQIFPKGFGILVLGRNASVATALARDEVERLKGRADELPYAIVPIAADGVTIDATRSPGDLGPMGDQVDGEGFLYRGSTKIGNWQLFSGANAFRRVLGESHQVPAPRLVGATSQFYGGLIVLGFGPIAYTEVESLKPQVLKVYANDMTQHLGQVDQGVQVGDDEYFVTNPSDATISVWLPTGSAMRYYDVSFSAYVQQGSTYVKRDFVSLSPVAVTGAAADVNGVRPPQQVLLSSQMPSGTVLGAVDLGSLRIRRAFQLLPDNTDDFPTDDPYWYKLLDSRIGVILTSPYAFGQYISTPSGRVPLQARVDYNVYDWRILREEFRLPLGLQAQHKLAVTGIKVAGQTGVDGKTIPFMSPVETGGGDDYLGSQAASNFLLVDLDTGGTYVEQDGGLVITVDKSNGLLTVKDLDNSTQGTQAKLRLPDGTVKVVTIDNRAIRALYMARNEYAVQVLKAATSYVQAAGTAPGLGEYVVGGGSTGLATRIYFPMMDLGRKVTFGVLNYRRTGDTAPRQLLDQDFVIAMPAVSDGVGLPCIDVKDVDSNAVGLDVNVDARSLGYAVRDVKGSSVAARVLWNPTYFHLGNNAATNMRGLEQWGRGWRKAVNETYLELGDLTR